MKSAVIFIHGNNKNSSTWNITEFGKVINIEKTISKQCRTMMLQLDDYTESPDIIVQPFLEEMKQYKWIIVCHSLGIIYYYELVKHLTVIGVCFIDCTNLEKYLKSHIDKNWNIIEYLKNTNLNITNLNIPSKIVFHIHCNYNYDKIEEFNDKLLYFTSFSRKNNKSMLIIHPNKGHMIHYTDSSKIINSIMILLKSEKY